MNIEELANRLNEESHRYEIGQLQNLRKEIRNLKRMPCSQIFTSSTIKDDYAFHIGGRDRVAI